MYCFGTPSFVLLTLWLSVSLSSGNIDWTLHKPRVCLTDWNYTRQEDEKTMVYVGIVVHDIYDISEREMEFSLQLELAEMWKDKNMKLQSGQIKKASIIPSYIAECIWKPETIFFNIKKGKLHDLTVPNIFFKIIPGEFVFRYSRLAVTVGCKLKFQYYPMDTQKCHLILKLLSATEEQVQLYWFGSPGSPTSIQRKAIVMMNRIRSPQFNIHSPKCHVSRNIRGTGTYTELYANFTFSRRLTASIVNTYIPSLLVTSLSWVSFWLEVDAVPGRVTLGVTTLLTLATEIVHARSALPSLDYMTALDVWLFGCLIMVFLSLVEFTVANSHARKKKASTVSNSQKAKQCWKDTISTLGKLPETSSVGVKNKTSSLKDSCWKLKFNAIRFSDGANVYDKCSRFIFPASMVLFVCVYWSFFLTRNQGEVSKNGECVF